MSNNTKKISFGSILLALFCIIMYIDALFPLANRSFLLLSSLFVVTAIIEFGFRGGLIFYISAVVLGMLIVPVKTAMILFGTFFGVYPLAKYIIDKIKFKTIRIMVSLVVGNILLGIIFLVYKTILFDFIMDMMPSRLENLEYTLPVIFALLIIYQVLVLIYDYFLELYIRYYLNKLRKFLKMSG